ncbi:hypothetical protein C8R45DRAFT_352854 [Mycena sanguinolenta]|nr:hypothetical protein C8R45DRAFT_352854 [Mycena sanguinolenta]
MASVTPTPTIFDFEAASAIVDPPLTPEQPPSTPSSSLSTSSPPSATTAATSPQSTATMVSSSSTSSASASIQTTAPAPSHLPTESPSESSPPRITPSTSPPTVALSTSESNVPPISTSAASNQALTSTHRQTLPTDAIVGIVIGACAIALLTILLSRLYRLRRKGAQFIISPVTPPDTDTEAASDVAGINDSDPNSTSEADPPPTRTMEIQEKFAYHGDSETEGPVSSSTAIYPPATRMRAFTAPSGSDTDSEIPSPDVMAQLREVTARVRQLEAQLESPPLYSGEGR